MSLNPLLVLSDDDLFRTQIVLAIACGRGKQILRDKSRKHLCTLVQVLGAEADRRGRPRPTAPFKA